MPEDKRTNLDKHTVSMEQRESISVTGVLDVLSFDEDSIIAETDMGILILRGQGLHVNRLNLDNGQLYVDGEIDSLEYSDSAGFSKGKNSFLSRLFK